MTSANIHPWLQPFLEATHRFNADIVGLPIPEQPQRLSSARKGWAFTALDEELQEFLSAESLEDEADALVDLAYFALGRLIEMGIVPGAVFGEVHAANMVKHRGTLSKRPNSLGYDAVKPEGWQPPNLLPYLVLTRQHLEAVAAGVLAEALSDLGGEPGVHPKVLILGHGRHGKDTVAEILRDDFGLSFTSSSMFCAEHVVWNALHNQQEALDRHIAAGAPGMTAGQLIGELEMMAGRQYSSWAECYADRSNFRAAWFSLIAGYCYPDRERLAREIFAENDIYVGLRNRREFHAVMNAGLPDLVLWVDASERQGPESMTSITVEEWMAHFTVDNNGTLAELRHNVHTLMANLGYTPVAE